MRSLLVGVTLALAAATASASADTLDSPPQLLTTETSRNPWNIDWTAIASETAEPVVAHAFALPVAVLQPPDQPQDLHPVAVEHSDAYQTRAKIHKYASYATLPLFAAEVALGQTLYNQTSSTSSGGALTGAHIAVGTAIMGLFGVNTVTGAWNLFGEGWSDKQGRTLRVVHGLLMIAADAGFVATAATGPSNHRGTSADSLTFDANKSTHRNIVYASIGVGTVGYLIMLIGNH